FSGGCWGDSGAECWSSLEAIFGLASADLFAAHLALIAAASCARRSGERFNFLFAFLTGRRFFALAFSVEDLAVARAADFLAAFNVFAASAAFSLSFSLASFFGPSCRRFSSRWIFFFKFFSFMMCPSARHEGELMMDLELKTKSRRCHARIEESENYEVLPP